MGFLEKNINFIYKKYNKAFCFYAIKFLHDEEAAKDIVQSAWIKTWLNKDKLEGENDVKNFTYSVIRNSCLDCIKVNNRKAARWIGYVVDDIEKDALYIMLNAELVRIIDSEVEKLTGNYKKVFKMAYYEGMSTLEIANKLNMSVKTIRNIIGISISKLKFISKI